MIYDSWSCKMFSLQNMQCVYHVPSSKTKKSRGQTHKTTLSREVHGSKSDTRILKVKHQVTYDDSLEVYKHVFEMSKRSQRGRGMRTSTSSATVIIQKGKGKMLKDESLRHINYLLDIFWRIQLVLPLRHTRARPRYLFRSH